MKLLKLKQNKILLISLMCVIIVSLVPRLIGLFSTFSYFGPEQGIEYLVTKSIIFDHQNILVAHQGGFGGFYKPAGFNYLLIIPFIISSGNPFGGRVLMFLISCLTVFLAFMLTKKMFNLRTAFFVSLLIAISPNLYDYAGKISPPFVVPLLIVVFIFFVYKIFSHQWKFIPWSVFIIGLTAHFETATTGILLAFFIIFGTFYFAKNKVSYKYILLSILAFVIAISPLLIYDLNHNFYNLKGILNMFAHSKSSPLSFNTALLSSRTNTFTWNYLSTFSPHWTLWPLTLAAMIIGTLLTLKDTQVPDKKRLITLFLALIPPFSFLFLLIYPGKIIHQWWITDLVVIYCFLLGISLNYFWQKKIIKSLVVIFLIALLVAFLSRLNTYKNDFSYPGGAFIKESKIVEYIYNDAKNEKFKIIAFSEHGTENYDYLVWWLNKPLNNNNKISKKKKLVYLIIDSKYLSKADTKNLNELSKSSILIKSKNFYNSLIIEKRYLN